MRRFKRPPQFPARPIYLKQWRKWCKVTLRKISQDSGLSEGSLSKIERGITPYYSDVLEVYAAILGIEIFELFHAPDSTRRDIDVWVAGLSESQRRQALRLLKALPDPKENNNPGSVQAAVSG